MKSVHKQLGKFLFVILLSLFFPLIFSQQGLSFNCNLKEVDFLIKQLKSQQQDSQPSTINKWGKHLYPKMNNEDFMCALIELINDDQSLSKEVRIQSVNVLGGVGDLAKPAIPHLLENLLENLKKSQDGEFSRALIEAIRRIDAKGTADTLIEALKNSDSEVRKAAAGALGTVTDSEFQQAKVKLIEILNNDTDPFVRQTAAEALATRPPEKPEDKQVKDALNNAIKSDPAWFVRNQVVNTLTKKGSAKLLDVDILITLLDGKDWTLVQNTLWSFYTMSNTITDSAKVALPKIINLAQLNPDVPVRVREQAVESLGVIDKFPLVDNLRPNNGETVKVLIKALRNDPDENIRIKAAIALSAVDPLTASSQRELMEFLNDKNEKIRVGAAQGISGVANFWEDYYQTFPANTNFLSQSWTNIVATIKKWMGSVTLFFLQDSYQISPKDSSTPEQAIEDLNNAIQIMESVASQQWQDRAQQEQFQQQKDIITRKLNALRKQQSHNWWQSFGSFLFNPVVMAVLLVIFLYLIIWRLRPLWLLKLDRWLKTSSFADIPLIGKPIVGVVSAISFLKYRPNVLDAWVEKYHKKVQDDFFNCPKGREHQIYIPLPVQIDASGEVKSNKPLTSQDLKDCFQKHLLIWGESGTGKTSMAFQIARWAISDRREERFCQHRMLPVLIDSNIDEEKGTSGEKPFIAAIRGKLEDAIKDTNISTELLEQLLRQRRILVIVDHFSEMNEVTRKLIRPDQPDFPVHALIVTSRKQESLGNVLSIQPSYLKGSQIAVFLENYINQRKARGLLTNPDVEISKSSTHLSEIVEQRSITPMFAKLYAEQIIQTKVTKTESSQNIPDLMIKYLDQLNQEVGENHSDELTVNRDAESVAWACLKKKYIPSEITRLEALAALGENDHNAEARLDYLEEKLHLIQTNQFSKDKIYFVIEPLAEYLAALHLIDICQENPSKWQEIEKEWDNIPKAFLIALRDCYEAKGQDANLTQNLSEKIRQVNSKLKVKKS